jgi:iron complex transport system substrate-binding protein
MVEVGHDQDVNLEVVLSLAPDLVMAYWTGIPQHEIHPKLMQAGIPVAINVEFMEPLPLGWAEWLKYVAVFFNLESEGERLFDEMAGEYDRLSALARKAGTRPTVLTGGNHRGTWYMGSGNSYFANMVRDAGAEYLWSDDRSTGVRTLDFETVFERAANADFWVNTGVYKSLDEVRSADPRHAALAAFKNRRIYNNNARLNEHGSSDYWESAAANPDRVLADLIRIFHPDLLPDHQLTWYHKLEFSDDPQKH